MTAYGNGMTMDRLTRVLDAYGAEPERWPAHERNDVLALLRTSPEAQAMREKAAALDAALDAGRLQPDLDREYVRRIGRTLPAGDGLENTPTLVSSVWRGIRPRSRTGWAGMTAAVAVGIMAGVLLSDLSVETARAPVTVAEYSLPELDLTEETVVVENAIPVAPPAISDFAALSLTGAEPPPVRAEPALFDEGENSLSGVPLL